MEEPDRTRQPEPAKIQKIRLPEIRTFSLNNELPVYAIHSEKLDVTRIDMIFNAGNWYQAAPLQPNFANAMLTEGTTGLTAEKIAGTIDYYGAYLYQETNNDTASVSLLTLKKYLPETIVILEDIIKRASFPEEELKTLVRKKKQNFEVESAKVKVLAQRKFQEALFGPSNPYGNVVKPDDFDRINRELLVDFYREHYHPGNCRIIISGNADEKVIAMIGEHFGDNKRSHSNPELSRITGTENLNNSKYYVERKDAVQSAIRIGRQIVAKNHPDYPGLVVLNTLLGGYFGSRLMTNIREDKGYTYGISSYLLPFRNASSFFIATEVASEVCKEAVIEIYHELRKICEEPVPEKELDRVRRYMMGEILREFDGPFAQSDSFRSLSDLGMDLTFYNKLISTINNINSGELNILANKYMHHSRMTEVVAGKIYS